MTIKKQRNNINPNIKPWMGFLGVPFEVCVCVCGGGGGINTPPPPSCLKHIKIIL